MYQYQTVLGRLEPASKARPLRKVARPNARPRRDQKQQEEACTTGNGGHGFLSTAFTAKVEGMPEELKNSRKVEQYFYASAANLCRLYGITFRQHRGLGYPINILQAFESLKTALNALDDQTHLRLITDEGEGRSAFLATLKGFNTKTTLYYLPVEPLYKMLNHSKGKRAGELLLSVLAYFYQLGGIPYFTENDCYIYYIYDMVSEYLLEEYSEEEQAEIFESICEEVLHRETAGNWLLSWISGKKTLEQLAGRTAAFRARDKTERSLLKIAQRVCRLMADYPHRSILDSTYGGMFTETRSDGETDSAVSVDQYISFIWSTRDSVYDQLMDSVNAELNELDSIDEPVSIQFFDAPQDAITHDLSFETEFFDLLNELSDNLDDFGHEKYNTLT